ncbi:MAG: tetratricopeptide repeat protein, partial [Bacteroidales bacterium]
PIKNPLESFNAMAQFDTAIRQLFEGEYKWSDILPWYYTPQYIFMTIPIAVIVGFIINTVLIWKNKSQYFWQFILYFAFIFPIFWIIYSNANVYGGWRHAIFVYPPMVVIAGLGFNALIDLIKNKWGKMAVTVLPFVLLITPLIHIIKNHPYEYVYFNELAGGMNRAYGNYEMDYYYHSTREASEWIMKQEEGKHKPGSPKIKVASWHLASVNYFFRHQTDDFEVSFSRWYERGNNDWDYAIFTVTGIAPDQIKNRNVFPPKNTVHTIEVDGKPICLILKRTDKSDMLGNQYKAQGKADTALYYLHKAIQLDPYNESALANLSELYFQLNRPDSAKLYIDQMLSFLPVNETANYFLAHYYMGKQQYDEAITTCKLIIKNNFKFRAAYHLMCNIYLRQYDVKNAEKILLRLIDIDQFDEQATQQLIEIYKAQGLNDRAAYRKLYKKFADSYKRGKKKEYETYMDLYRQLR